MTILQTKFYSIPVLIENFTASAHITYYAHITPHLTLYIGLGPTVMLTWLSRVQHSSDVGLMSLVYWMAIDWRDSTP